MEEQELLENIKAGQVGAFKTLVEQHREKVRNACFRLARNKVFWRATS